MVKRGGGGNGFKSDDRWGSFDKERHDFFCDAK